VQAERIAQGASGVRLDVPAGPRDEISRLGTTLNTMLDAQERSAERQRQFIDDASHELRTPLTTLGAEIDLALRKPRTAEEYEASLRRLSAGATQLMDLTETLLALGALGSATPDARDIDARTALEAAARRARGQLPSSRSVEVAAGAVRLRADARLLDLALGNLVDNAVRYGAGTITLTAAQDAGAVLLAVHDDGPGIALDFLPHAAERFRQDERSRTGAGAGLGLALVEAIVTAHGGQLRLCSRGHHHLTPHAELSSLPCRHPDSGTTASIYINLS
jgi:two-component system OmpR family sensor kinase